MKADRELTKAMKFQDPRSFIGKRLHPGTTHQCIYARGKDVGPIREAIYKRDGGLCTLKLSALCSFGRILPFEGEVWDRWHLEHEVGGLGLQRCWCAENLRGACWHCHQVKDGRQPRWTQRGAA